MNLEISQYRSANLNDGEEKSKRQTQMNVQDNTNWSMALFLEVLEGEKIEISGRRRRRSGGGELEETDEEG